VPLAPIGSTRFVTAFETTVIGFAASFLLPARPGEVLRPYLLAKREGLPATPAFATIILERLLDLVTVVLLFGVFVLFIDPASISADPMVYARVKTGGLIAAAGLIAGLALFFVLAVHPALLGQLALRIEGVLPARLARLVAQSSKVAQGLRDAPPGTPARSPRLVRCGCRSRWASTDIARVSYDVQLSRFVPRDDAARRGVALDAGQVGGFHDGRPRA
jgi:hypothetical protein